MILKTLICIVLCFVIMGFVVGMSIIAVVLRGFLESYKKDERRKYIRTDKYKRRR